MFDIADCEPLHIEQVSAPGLLLPISEDDGPILCLADNDSIAAVFLSGEWIHHSDKVGKLSNRKGLFVPNVSVRVDLESIAEDSASTVGAIVRSPGVYGVRTHRIVPGDFTQKVIVPIAGQAPQFAPDAVRVAFTKWEVGKMVGDDWIRLWAVDLADLPNA
jgi:hypothetical protein